MVGLAGFGVGQSSGSGWSEDHYFVPADSLKLYQKQTKAQPVNQHLIKLKCCAPD